MKIVSIALVISIMVFDLTSCSAFALRPTQIPTLTRTDLPVSTNMPEPTVGLIETPVLQYAKTANPATFVDTQDGKQLINNRYGFSITLPSDIDILSFNPTDNRLISVQFPSKDLSDGGQIFKSFSIWIENQTDNCHPELINSSSRQVKIEQATLGSTYFKKAYTPDLNKDELQAIEYMTCGTDFCVHFFIGLAMYYFDRGDAEPDSMLPYVQDELDSIISTFEWVK